MTERHPGMRVGVFPVNLVDCNHAYHLGKGTYEGDFRSPFEFTLKESPLEDFGKLEGMPRIQLDSGEIIWGIECFWMPEGEFDESLKAAEEEGKIVTQVPFAREDKSDLN